jgi:hypothetical protein
MTVPVSSSTFGFPMVPSYASPTSMSRQAKYCTALAQFLPVSARNTPAQSRQLEPLLAPAGLLMLSGPRGTGPLEQPEVEVQVDEGGGSVGD